VDIVDIDSGPGQASRLCRKKMGSLIDVLRNVCLVLLTVQVLSTF